VARIRSIKPELPSSKKLTAASIEARYTLVLLITQADDEGFVLAEPRQLLGVLYPHDEAVTSVELEEWIRQLVAVNSLVVRHTTEGARVLQLVGWHEHQAVKNAGKPKISPLLLPLSVESTEDGGRNSVAEVRRFGGSDVRILGGSEGGESEAPTSPAGPADAPTSLLPLSAEAHGAASAYSVEHRDPGALRHALIKLADPLGGNGFGWPVVGQALVEMRANGCAWSTALCAGYCKRIAQGPRPDAIPIHAARRGSTRQAQNLAAIAEGLAILEAQEAASGQL